MNTHSPGSPSDDEDIEMIDLEHAVDTKDPPPYAPLKREESDEEDDDANEEVEDSSQALLSQNRARLPHLTEKRWPQIRNIVIEVQACLLSKFSPTLITHRARHLSY